MPKSPAKKNKIVPEEKKENDLENKKRNLELSKLRMKEESHGSNTTIHP